MRLLVIEDDQEMAETVAIGLRRAGMAVDVALDGPAGLERALACGPVPQPRADADRRGGNGGSGGRAGPGRR